VDAIRVMVVDDHDVVRAGLRTLLESEHGIEVVAEAADGDQAVEEALRVRPDVILMDITMPRTDGLQATRRLRSLCPDCMVLTLTVHEDKEYFMAMLAAGASGYITKQAAADELVAAIRAVAAGNVYLQPALARWLLEDYQRLAGQTVTLAPGAGISKADDAIGLDILTARERQVLEMVAHGLNNEAIGARLTLSPKTIARHRERIMNKLNMHNRTELVKFAIRTGLIALE